MNPLFKIDLKKSFIVFTCLIVIALFLVFAYSVYPVPGGDSIFYLAPAVQFAARGTLISPFYSEWLMDKIVDPSGMKRFLYYPPLFPLAVSALMPQATPQGALIAIALINIAVIALSILLFYKVATRKESLDWKKVFLIVIALLALASSLTETGRPETLARLWVALGALVYFYAHKKYDWVFYGILLGLMFATHPAGGIFSIFILGMVFGATLKLKDVFLKGSATFFLGFLVFLGVIILGPFGISETIGGIFRHIITLNHIIAQLPQKFFTPSNMFKYFIAFPTAPFYAFVMLLVPVAGIFFYRKYRKCLVSTWLVLVCAAMLVYLFGKAISLGHAFYTTLFAPLIFSIFIYLFLESGRFWKSVTITVLLLVATGFLRTTLLFPFFLKQGVTLEEARAHFARLTRPYEGKNVLFGVTGGLWTLTENYEKVYSYNTWPDKPKERTALVFFQQRYSGMLTPPPVDGCALTYDSFSKSVPKIFGVKLGNTMPGYGYAVYDCFNL
ncbi:MAG: hypothetical protein Q8P01_03030 [bacterium]|nr:hypothetical protein [bacterium]